MSEELRTTLQTFHASLRRHYPYQVMRVCLTLQHPLQGPLRVMFKLMEIWDNCKLEAQHAPRQFLFFDKHLTTHERHHTGLSSVFGPGTQPFLHG